MIRLAAFLLVMLAVPAGAEEVTMSDALQAASLHEGPLDVLALTEPRASGVLELTVSFAPRTVTMMSAAPHRIVLALGDGDDVVVEVPGYPQARYRFRRDGAAVRASVRTLPGRAEIVAGF